MILLGCNCHVSFVCLPSLLYMLLLLFLHPLMIVYLNPLADK